MMKRCYYLVILSCLLAVVPPSNSSRVRSLGFKELVEQSAVVLIATVIGQQFRLESSTEEPYTDSTLKILDVVKGAGEVRDLPNKQLVLPFSGGMTDKGQFEVIIGMPSLTMGETYLLFLRGGQWSVNPITGWHQGVFRLIAYDERGSHMLFNVYGEALMDVRDDRLIFQTTRSSGRPVQAQDVKEGDQGIHIQHDIDLAKLQETLKNSLYREGNRGNLTKQDEERASIGAPEQKQRVAREDRIKALLGREPLLLNKFSDLIRQIPESGNPELRKFNVRPLPSSQGEGQARKTK